MEEGIQRIYEKLGESGCYFICIYKLAEMLTGRKYDLVDEYKKCLSKRYIERDCFVYEPAKILSDITSLDFAISKQPVDYSPLENEYEITLYTNGKYGHFVITQDGKVVFDPLGDSVTVADGQPSSKRVFTLLRGDNKWQRRSE